MIRRLLTLVVACCGLLAIAENWSDYAQKIHGKDDTGNKIVCKSYENDLSSEDQYMLIEHAMLAAAAYQDDSKAYGDTERIKAYEETKYVRLTKAEIESLIDPSSGLVIHDEGNGNFMVSGKDKNAMNAVLFKDPKDGTIVISYRGSKEAVDWVDDAVQVINNDALPQQYKDSSALLNSVLSHTTANVICDGHSLGGGEVTYAIADNDIMKRDASGNLVLDENGNPISRVSGYTYNAAGLSENTMEMLASSPDGLERIKYASQNIINVRNEKDPVSYVAYHLGDSYEVKWSASSENAHTVLNDHGIEHLIENMISASGFENVWNIVESPVPLNATQGNGQGQNRGQGGANGKTTVGSLILEKVNGLIDAQIAKIVQGHPFLKEVLSALNINGKSITGAVINILGVLQSAPDLQAALKGLSHLAIEGLKNMAASIISWGLSKLEGLICNLIDKALDWILRQLNKLTNSISNSLVREALGLLQKGIISIKGKGVSSAVHTLRQSGVKAVQQKIKAQPAMTKGGQVFQDVINRVK